MPHNAPDVAAKTIVEHLDDVDFINSNIQVVFVGDQKAWRGYRLGLMAPPPGDAVGSTLQVRASVLLAWATVLRALNINYGELQLPTEDILQGNLDTFRNRLLDETNVIDDGNALRVEEPCGAERLGKHGE